MDDKEQRIHCNLTHDDYTYAKFVYKWKNAFIVLNHIERKVIVSSTGWLEAITNLKRDPNVTLETLKKAFVNFHDQRTVGNNLFFIHRKHMSY